MLPHMVASVKRVFGKNVGKAPIPRPVGNRYDEGRLFRFSPKRGVRADDYTS